MTGAFKFMKVDFFCVTKLWVQLTKSRFHLIELTSVLMYIKRTRMKSCPWQLWSIYVCICKIVILFITSSLCIWCRRNYSSIQMGLIKLNMAFFYIHHDIVHLIPQNSLQYDLQPIVSKVRAFRWMEEKLYYISLVSVNFFPVLMGICSLNLAFFPYIYGHLYYDILW